MNSLAADKLRQAAIDGVPQITGRLYELDGPGRCALGVLEYMDTTAWYRRYGVSFEPTTCPVCNEWQPSGEVTLITHLNDIHRMDFLGIANKLERVEGEHGS